jgi:cyclophilin family peptidyl-prolyl cis-trans isomerase
LFHFAGVLSAAEGPEPGTSLGSRFTLTCEPAHDLDGKQVVFGTIESGVEIVAAISRGAAAPESPETPTDPVVLNAIERL